MDLMEFKFLECGFDFLLVNDHFWKGIQVWILLLLLLLLLSGFFSLIILIEILAICYHWNLLSKILNFRNFSKTVICTQLNFFSLLYNLLAGVFLRNGVYFSELHPFLFFFYEQQILWFLLLSIFNLIHSHFHVIWGFFSYDFMVDHFHDWDDLNVQFIPIFLFVCF